MGLETTIEGEARKYMLSLGGVLLKFTSPGNNGVPDRIACHPNCGPFLIEFKSPGKYLRADQREMCTELALRGFRIYAGRNWEGVQNLVVARQIIEDEVNGVAPYARRHPIVDGF